jgi:hypothetical protein
VSSVFTVPDNQLTEKKESTASGLTFNIVVKSLEELTDTMKIRDFYLEYYNLLTNTQFTFSSLLDTLYSLKTQEPVYVQKDESGDESIIYNSGLMELEKTYEIQFRGEKWALRKNKKSVEFMKK